MKKVAVIGAGTMGNGIAHVFALHQHQVDLIDVDQAALDKGMSTIQKNLSRQVKKELISETDLQNAQQNITTHAKFSEVNLTETDLVIEAASENLEVKTRLFKQLGESCHKNCILATNTSSISITQLASHTMNPERVIGMHFMNPVPVMKLVEIIRGFHTSQTSTDLIVSLAEKLGKIPVVVNDYPGFISNRILMPMINEAIFSLYEGVAGVEEIDQIMKLGMAHPMGPLELADFIGLDVCLAILKVLYDGFRNPKYAPCPLLVNMVEAKSLGRKSGSGFYLWNEKEKKVNPKILK
ncbi:MAG: 3-hydroxyacyl-CoA dehydrogenase family protein [Candidatus Cyclobacteriaceae bacterium M3_2C_046]